MTTRADLGPSLPSNLGLITLRPNIEPILSLFPVSFQRYESADSVYYIAPAHFIKIHPYGLYLLTPYIEVISDSPDANILAPIIVSEIPSTMFESEHPINEAVPRKRLEIRNGGRTIICRWVCPKGWKIVGGSASQTGRICPRPRPRCVKQTGTERAKVRRANIKRRRSLRRVMRRAQPKFKRSRSLRRRKILIH